MTWDPSLASPRTLYASANDARRAFRVWTDSGRGETILNINGQVAPYTRSTRIRDYDFEVVTAWEYNRLDNSSTSIAQGFWIWAQEDWAARQHSLSDVMTPEEATLFMEWNSTVAGRRKVGPFNLPWVRSNAEAITRGETESRWADDRLAYVRQDVNAFWAWKHKAQNVEKYVPEDPDGPLDVRDPRVRHLWVKSADVARQKDMCSSYDQVARDVGVPDRNTLRASGELKPSIRLTWNGRLQHTFVKTPETPDYVAMDRTVTGTQIREWLDKMNDEELRAAFTVYDQKVLD